MSENMKLADLDLPDDVRDAVVDAWLRDASARILESIERHVDTKAALAALMARVHAEGGETVAGLEPA